METKTLRRVQRESDIAKNKIADAVAVAGAGAGAGLDEKIRPLELKIKVIYMCVQSGYHPHQ